MTSSKSAGVMHHQQVDIGSIKVCERLIECFLDVVRMVIVAPELRTEKDFFTRDATPLDAFADLLLDIVNPRRINKA